MPPVDRDKIAEDWQNRGFTCDLWTGGPGQQWNDFVHDSDEVVVVVEGEMEFEIAGERSHPAIGEEIFIPAGAVHSTRNLGGTTALWLYGYR